MRVSFSVRTRLAPGHHRGGDEKKYESAFWFQEVQKKNSTLGRHSSASRPVAAEGLKEFSRTRQATAYRQFARARSFGNRRENVPQNAPPCSDVDQTGFGRRYTVTHAEFFTNRQRRLGGSQAMVRGAFPRWAAWSDADLGNELGREPINLPGGRLAGVRHAPIAIKSSQRRNDAMGQKQTSAYAVPMSARA